MNIVFSKDDHRYSSYDKEYTSVSKLIAKYKNEFDKDHWSTYKALERIIPNFKDVKKGWKVESPEFVAHASGLVDSEELSAEVKKILKEWEKENVASIRKGNKYHERKEKKSYAQGYEINPFTQQKVPIAYNPPEEGEKTNIVHNLYDLEDGYYPELLIWNEEKLLAGQADKVFIETVLENGIYKRVIDIDDYKTNKKITKNGFKGKRMKNPLSHLQDCNYVHYNLQISLYAWMLEQFGFVPRNLSFHHFNQIYPLPYLREEVNLIV